jgi:pyruvate dehydrogenase E1 component alpha subunit
MVGPRRALLTVGPVLATHPATTELRLLDAEGTLTGPCPMTDGEVVEALRWMLLSRTFDALAIKLQRMNRVGVYGPATGQEAAIVGSAMALDPSRDWLIPASREQAAWLRHGFSLENLLAIYMGRLDHARIPDSARLLPRQQAIGAQLPHATGLAWALRLRGERAAALVYFGEGAASEGDFHEAANLAGVQRVPLVFFLINNRYAISTPAARQTAANDLSLRAAGYGFPGIAVDGNDVFAVYAATRAAVERALAGDGPTLIEARTYRLGFHNTSDNPDLYRARDEEAAALAIEPIERLRRYATAADLWSDDQEREELAALSQQLDAAYRVVAALPRPGPEAVFEHVYAELTPRQRRQRAEILASLGKT